MTDEPPCRYRCRAEVGDELRVSLAAPMTVIKGNAHLVRRWIQTGAGVNPAVSLARLDAIETMVDRLVATIADLRSTPDGHPSPGSRNPLRDPGDDRS